MADRLLRSALLSVSVSMLTLGGCGDAGVSTTGDPGEVTAPSVDIATPDTLEASPAPDAAAPADVIKGAETMLEEVVEAPDTAAEVVEDVVGPADVEATADTTPDVTSGVIDAADVAEPVEDVAPEVTSTEDVIAPADVGPTPEVVEPPCDPPAVNALIDEAGALLPLVDGHAWRQGGGTLTLLSADGVVVWTVETPPGALFGGFDFDADGWTDAGIVQSQPTGEVCGSTPLVETWITFIRGVDGGQVSGVSPVADLCWEFGDVIYPTSQWTGLGVLFGDQAGVVALAPYYATTGWFFSWLPGTGWTSEAYLFPSTSAYDATYQSDQLNGWGTGTSFLANSHIANGLVTEVLGESRFVFFTSGRVVQYRVGPLDSAQLVVDTPYLTGGRTDIAGRNYGLVALAPDIPDHLVLLGGTDMQTVAADRVAGEAISDPWGQIERHVSRVDLTTGAVEDRFFSYAHDDNDGHQYEGRVVYPATPWAGDGQLAFNVFGAGTWTLHVTESGGTADAWTQSGLVVWDIADLDGDGVDEWVTSPTAGYLPEWHTDLWHRVGDELVLQSAHPGVIPYLVGRFREGARTTSRGWLYTVSTVLDGCSPRWVGLGEDGVVVNQPL